MITPFFKAVCFPKWYPIFVSSCLSFGNRYENKLKSIFYQWPKLYTDLEIYLIFKDCPMSIIKVSFETHIFAKKHYSDFKTPQPWFIRFIAAMVIIRNYLDLDLKIGKVSREKILSDHVSITIWMRKKNNDSATTLMKEIIKNLFMFPLKIEKSIYIKQIDAYAIQNYIF